MITREEFLEGIIKPTDALPKYLETLIMEYMLKHSNFAFSRADLEKAISLLVTFERVFTTLALRNLINKDMLAHKLIYDYDENATTLYALNNYVNN